MKEVVQSTNGCFTSSQCGCSHVHGYQRMKAVSRPGFLMRNVVLVLPQREKLYEAMFSMRYTPFFECQPAQVSLQ